MAEFSNARYFLKLSRLKAFLRPHDLACHLFSKWTPFHWTLLLQILLYPDLNSLYILRFRLAVFARRHMH